MSDEFAIDAGIFADILLAQRASRMKGGIYHLTQIEMAYNSNRIEGSRLSSEQTRNLFETKTISGEAPVDDVIEMTNSFRLFDRMLENVAVPLTSRLLKEYHLILKSGTEDSRRQWFQTGDWKALANEVGGVRTTEPESVDQEITALLQRTPSNMSFADVCDFHYAFERIHPFQDGNGRIGRIVMFGQCLANGIMPFVVLDEVKSYYYRGLKEYDDDPTILRETLRSCQDRYFTRFQDFVPRGDTGISR